MPPTKLTSFVPLVIRNRYFFFADVLLLSVGAWLSFIIRLDTEGIQKLIPTVVIYAGTSVVAKPLVFYFFGLYHRYWRYASADDLLLIGAGTFVAIVVVSGLVYLVLPIFVTYEAVPRSIPVIDWLLTMALVGGVRFAARVLPRSPYTGRTRPSELTRVLVMGAGDAGAMIVRELKHNPQLGMEVVGFIDDDLGKHDVRIHGVPVLGDRHDLLRVAQLDKVHEVIIAMPTASGKAIREIVHICEQADVRTKIIPGMYELLDGTVSVGQLRNVEIEDLLRREPIQTDTASVSAMIRGKRVLVTGGGGSIGSELCRQIWRCGPAALVVLGHGENSIFDIVNELERAASAAGNKDRYNKPLPVLHAVVADIRFADRIRAVFEERRPDIVFHAAAHKHVPLMELNPTEAITNNVLGTRNLLDSARATGVEHFVMISTDKIVNPTSVMGASKRVAELLVHQAAVTSGKPYVAVRFGNVLGSRGSVVLTFKQQIAAGGPVTVTHPDMRRYFMTIPEAVQLVLQAAVLGQGGEVFVLDMGEPVKIVDLAKDLIELSGLGLGRDVDIVFTGMRPGEKLFEELFVPGEDYRRTGHEKIFVASNAGRFVPSHLDQAIEALEIAAQTNDTTAIADCLRNLIVEYRPNQPSGEVRAGELEKPAMTYPLAPRLNKAMNQAK
jgi:FlaA1/EpsC-like NDP-sugar epimerase